jgi:5-formyltetrahydrofolate cyclo-ligase
VPALSAAEALIIAAAQRLLPTLVPTGKYLGLYWPLPGEPDLRPVAPAHPCLALPAVDGDPAQLHYRSWRAGSPLIPDRYGIPAPAPPRPDFSESERPERELELEHEPGLELEYEPEHQSELSQTSASGRELSPDAMGLLLVPALAFAPHSGIRLGYGGGWYDRLRAHPAWAAVPALVVLPSACLSGNLPREAWDVPFHGWLDEHGVHSIAAPAAAAPEDGPPAPTRL